MAHDRVQQDFTELNNESYVIEQKLQEYYRNLGYIVIDRSQDKEYQEKDIDFDVISDVNTTLSVEVKADKVMYETGNIMVEHGHIRPSKVRTKGWFLKCQADIICYTDTVNNHVYVLDWVKLRPQVREISDIMRFKNPHDLGTITQAYLLPVTQLREQGFIIKEFTL